MTFSNYSQAIRYLYRRNQFAIKLGLNNISKLLASRGSPHNNQAYAHVAGTNGKGSVCAYIAGILRELGYKKVGLYTSPHLVSFRERITVDGEPISQDYVCWWLNEAFSQIEMLQATYFECVTAMAIEYFRDNACEITVIETGLGGRLDATNCLVPLVSVITSVSLDHMDILGNTIESIWGEKIAILKPGIPMVVNQPDANLWQILLEKGENLHTKVYNLHDFSGDTAEYSNSNNGVFSVKGKFKDYTVLFDPLLPSHLLKNLALSIFAVEVIRGAPLPNLNIFKKLPVIPGRQQLLNNPLIASVILDGGHNEESIKSLVEYVKRQFPLKRLHVIMAFMKDKDVKSNLRHLLQLNASYYFAELAENPRSMQLKDFKETLSQIDPGIPYSSFNLNFSDIKEFLFNSEIKNDIVLFCGSFYLIGAAIPLIMSFYKGLSTFQALCDE